MSLDDALDDALDDGDIMCLGSYVHLHKHQSEQLQVKVECFI